MGIYLESVTAQSVVKSLHREIVLENGEHANIEMQKGSGNKAYIMNMYTNPDYRRLGDFCKSI